MYKPLQNEQSLGDENCGQTPIPFMHLRQHQIVSLLIGECAIGFGIIVKLSPEGLWFDHKIKDRGFVIVRVKGVARGFGGFCLPYPTMLEFNLTSSLNKDVLWRAIDCKPLQRLNVAMPDASFHGHSVSQTLLQTNDINLGDVGHKPTMTLKRNCSVALILEDVMVARGRLCKLSPRGEWCGHKLEDTYYVIVKITKTICGQEHKHCPYPASGIANMQDCVDCEVLWRAHNCRPIPDNQCCPSQGSTFA